MLATNNTHKLTEMRRILAERQRDIEVLGLADVNPYREPAETESDFAGNALLKARACVRHTGLPALADDSGLSVDILNGMPGVRSARWSGPDKDDDANNALLLQQLWDVPPERRAASFQCAVALVLPDGREFTRLGEMHGRLLSELRGSGGFGYDMMFVPEGEQRTSAELDPAAKDALSHRGKALRRIVPVLVETLTPGSDEPSGCP